MKKQIEEKPLERYVDRHGKFISFKKINKLSQWVALELTNIYILTLKQLINRYLNQNEIKIPEQTMRDAIIRLMQFNMIGKRHFENGCAGRQEIAYFLKKQIWEVFIE